jgi:caspase 7
MDRGVNMHYTKTDDNAMSYKIPSHADFLIAYSTIPGFYSWRNTTDGSWFVQALCDVLQRNGHSHDLLSNLTRVARKMAFDFKSNNPRDVVMEGNKQIPCITSMLTRDIIFTKKCDDS